MNPTHRIAIFRTGTHTAMSGASRTYTAADLAACAAAYAPTIFEAPLVVGHPETNTPAFGWVRCLLLDGETLYADVADVDPAFAEAVNAGRYKKISSAFYLPESPSNPAPGALYLRHVGFLGGQSPAVKGLPAVSFAAGDYEEIDVYGCATSLIQFGQPPRDSHDPQVRALPVPPPEGEKKTRGGPSFFSEEQSNMPDPKTPTEQDLAAFAEAVRERDALAAEVAQLKADAARRERESLHREHVAFCETQVAAGRIPSGVAATFAASMDAIASAGEVQFSEGKTVLVAFREALAALPPMLDTREKAGNTGKTAMSRSDFEALGPDARMAAVKAGVSLS